MTQLIVKSEDVEGFAKLFRGYEGAYGQYTVNHKDESGKMIGAAKTIAHAASIENYQKHLSGEIGIGIVPLLKDEKVWFGAIDIDIKGTVKLKEDHFILEARVRELGLPLMVCRSKSDGIHMYLFAYEPISARLMQSRLTEMTGLLGYAGCEVFPKQVTRLKETDYGNWINIPYFGATRQLIHEGKQYEDVADFIRIANKHLYTERALRKFQLPISDLFSDGPPCLQQLSTTGFSEGGRNNALLNVAIYYKKVYPDDWQDKVLAFNSEHISPALPHEEVSTICKGVGKKDYNYTCKQHPINAHCNRQECKKREFGVSSGKENNITLPITSLTKYISKESCRWTAHTNEASVDFSTEELFSFEAHRRKLVEVLNIVLPTIKQDSFIRQISELVSNCEVVYDPDDVSESGNLLSAFLSWFETTGSAETYDDMIMDKWYLDEKTGKIFFQGDALLTYLDRHKKIKVQNKHKFYRLLKQEYNTGDYKLEDDRITIKGNRKRVLVLSGYKFQDKSPLSTPDVKNAVEIF